MTQPISRLTVLALSVLALAPAAQAPGYTITDVSGALNGDAIGVAGLSDTGFVCGWLNAIGNAGFRWSPDGGRAESIDPGQLAWADCNSVDVNDSGAVVGLFGRTSGGLSLTNGYVRSNGVTTELLSPLGFRALPRAINDAGAIVGRVGGRPGGTPGAVLWRADFTPTFVADFDDAFDINERGQIIGVRRIDEVYQGYLYEDGVATPLGTLDPANRGDVFPRAIDERGNVFGTSEIDGIAHPFRWTPETGMVELPGIGEEHPPFGITALDTNDAGAIVGYALDGLGVVNLMWSPDGSVHELEPLLHDVGPEQRWQELFLVLRINSSGQIAGTALRDGRLIVVLLTPTALRVSASGGSTLTVEGAAPGRKTFLAADFDDPFDRGYRRLPRARALGLAMAKPTLVAAAVADASGHATLRWTPPAGLEGVTIRLQVFQLGAPAVSNVVRVTL